MGTDHAKISTLLFEVGRKLREAAGQKRKETPFSMLHFQTLRYVEKQEKPLMCEVAGYLCVTPPAATLLIDSLVRERLLSRAVDPKDRRAVHLSLTERGKKLLTKGTRARLRTIEDMVVALTPREKEQFVATLEKMLKGK